MCKLLACEAHPERDMRLGGFLQMEYKGICRTKRAQENPRFEYFSQRECEAKLAREARSEESAQTSYTKYTAFLFNLRKLIRKQFTLRRFPHIINPFPFSSA